jgi:hypothetical protein
VILAGTGATALATALTGGAIGAAAGGLGGALIGVGIPEQRARHYNDRVARGGYLIMVDGTEEEIRRAEAILTRWGIEDWGIYDAPGTDTRPTPAPDYTTRAVEEQPEVRAVDHQPKVIIVDHRNEVL